MSADSRIGPGYGRERLPGRAAGPDAGTWRARRATARAGARVVRPAAFVAAADTDCAWRPGRCGCAGMKRCAACGWSTTAPPARRIGRLPRLTSPRTLPGTQNVLDAAVRAGTVERFLHVSTTDVYGYPRVPCDESAPMRDVGLPYNRTKIQGEEAVWRAHREHGLPVTVRAAGDDLWAARQGLCGGDRQAAAAAADAADRWRTGARRLHLCGQCGAGDDGCGGEHQTTVGRAYNISDGTGTTWREYTNALADALDYPRPWLRLPFSAAMALAPAMEAAQRTLRLPGRPLLTRHAVHLLGQDQEFPAARAREDFGFAPRVSFAEGMARSAAWVRSQASSNS